MTGNTELNENDEHDATTAESDEAQELYETVSPTATRRDILKGAGMTAALAAGGPAATEVAAAQDAEDAAKAVARSTTAGAAALKGILAGKFEDLSNPMSKSDASNALANSLHDSTYANGVELSMWTDLHHTAVENQLTMLSDFVRQNVQYRVVEEASAGATLQETKSAAVSEAEQSVSRIEKNFFQAYILAATQVARLERNVYANNNLSEGNVFRAQGYASDGTHVQKSSSYTYQYFSGLMFDTGNAAASYYVDYPLLNGETVTDVPVFARDYDGDAHATLMFPWAEWPDNSPPSFQYTTETQVTKPLETINTWSGGSGGFAVHTEVMVHERDGSDGLNNEPIIDLEAWMNLHDKILTLRNNEPTYAEQITETLYEPAANGEITVDEVSGAAAILDVADKDSWTDPNEAAAVYRSTNIPEAKDEARIETADGSTLEGILFWSQPSGDGLPVGEEIDPSATDDSGNSVWPGEFFIAAEATNVPAAGDVKYPVEVKIVDGNGNAVSDATVRVYDGSGNVLAEETDPTEGLAELNVTGGSNREISVTWMDSNNNSQEASQMLNISSGIEAKVDTSASSMETWTMEEYIGAQDIAEGDIVAGPLRNPFTIVEAGTEPLPFEERDLTEPDNSQEEMIQKLLDAYEKEQESQKELQVTIKDETAGTGGGGAVTDDNDDLLMIGAGLLGFGFIVSLLASFADGGGDDTITLETSGDDR
ncbi:hypothetical protein [Haloferax volcanii]|uniref:Envelope protein N-terminal domain-containing protein n=1 Tax=Haloferax volcanii JCM 10717 TaxID=1227458 RepID=M0IDP8_HALVO|nr:hypothetical protein [Haloferax alexandrinus]ELZ93544.1 hypothetical protein C452_04968 [Haloferax alexandrinus JCM 10717]